MVSCTATPQSSRLTGVANDDKTPLLTHDKTSAPAAAGRWTLTLVHGPPEAARTEYPFVSIGTFGRSEESQFIVADGRMSRRHFAIAALGDVCEVKDNHSTNGTMVDGSKALTNVARHGSVIRAGESLFVLERRTAWDDSQATPGLIGRSQAWLQTLDQLSRAAKSAFPILISGETGTGKELLARYIHDQSGRAGRYVPVNCAAIPRDLAESIFFGHKKGSFTGAVNDSEGHFRNADGGTLFLDEVGDMPTPAQAKLLRVLDSGEVAPVGTSTSIRVDVRIVAATNVSPAELRNPNVFRQDLLGRLSGVVVHTPPLRDRKLDIIPFFTAFYDEGARNAGRTPGRLEAEAAELLLLHPYRMNVRELRSIAHRLSLLNTDVLTRQEVMSVLEGFVDEREADEPGGPTKEALTELLVRYDGRISDVALVLECDRKQVYRWMKRHALQADDFRKRAST